jgi:hypothetical protein
METRITEGLICRLWQSRLVTSAVTDSGDSIYIIFPGRTSNRSGCDFKDAVFNLAGRTIVGDIEVHIKSSQWQRHGHHQDPKYNGIILHVVWEQDSHAATVLQNGRTIPTLCLRSSVVHPLEKLSKLPPAPLCPMAARHSGSAAWSTLLTAAGLKRFSTKTALFRKALDKEDAAQVLYRGIARALGYVQNAEPCQALAQRLTIKEISEYSAAARRSLLLGQAGLLPSQRGRQIKDIETIKLESIWRASGTTQTMKAADWCFFRVRPDNFPTRRLVALSYLLMRYGKEGLLPGILRLVETARANGGHHWLENGLVTAARGYWLNHLDLGVPTHRASALIGYGKASAIALNVVLPFTVAIGKLCSDSKLKKKATRIYRRYPGTADNELTRFMKLQLRLPLDIRFSACQQQGLIHLFNTYCCRRDCFNCPVGQG